MDSDKNLSQLLALASTFYLDDRTSVVCSWFLYTVVCQLINIFGIATNIVNIVCFVKQRFKDTTNISLLGLSVSDLGGLITLACVCIFLTPAVVEADLPFESTDVQYMIFMMPHFAFTRVSSCITAFITLERCLSIVAPLKVKSIITNQRAGMIVVSIFIVFTFSATPVYTVNSLGTIFSVSRNTTIVGLIYTDEKEQVEMYTFLFNNFLIPFSSFIIVVVCTVILTSQLRKHSKWRRKTTINNVQAQKMNSRNKKVSKMVVSIATLFISCFVPVSIMALTAGFVPDMSINRKYFNAAKMLGGCTLIFESINASVNIIIYYHMSSKFRDTFRSIFISLNTRIS